MVHDEETILALRRLIADTVEPYDFTDEQLDGYLIRADSDLKIAAATIWREKAALYAELVDITEAGSSRKNSDLYKRALEQAEVLDPPVDPTATRGTVVRSITRA